MQQQIDDTERDAIFQRLKSEPENNKCFDCDKKNPKWASVYLGLYLCLDCAGKHREYGPQISFARSLNLDTWNKRYITFMELGGNAKALEYFKKHGLKAPYDYKAAIIQKYKQDITKKVDALLENSASKEEAPKAIYANKAEEHKSSTLFDNQTDNKVALKSFSDKPTHGETASNDPFANNIVLNKEQTKTKGFTVEFNKNKTTGTANKGRIAAKKIENVDLDALTLNEDPTDVSKNKFDMTESHFGDTNKPAPVKEVFAKSSSPYLNDQSEEEKLKKFQNAKAISSDSFKTESQGYEPSNVKKFAGATAISSAQYFGEKEEAGPNGIDYYQTAENVKEFITNVSGKLKEKADGLVSRIKDKWQQN